MRRPVLFFAFPLAALYLACLAPSVHVHDAGELTAAAWILGIGHPPGAPLYMLLHKAFLLLIPLGHIAWRANLFSAVCALAAFFLFETLAFRLTKREWLSAFGALAFALSPTFWSQAEMAEVYTLQAALLAGFLLAFVRAREEGTPMRLPALLWGLLLACHMGLALITPLVWLVLIRPAVPGWKPWLRSAIPTGLWMAGPLLLYLYLPLRSLADPAVDWGDPETLRNFWWHLTNRQVRGRMLSLPLDMYLRRSGEYGLILVQNLHLLLPFVFFRAWKGWGGHRRLMLILSAAFAMDAAFVVLMDTAPLASEAYAVPSVLALTVLAVLGLGSLRSRSAAAVPALAAAVSAFLFFPVNNLSRNFLVRDMAEAVLQQSPRGAVLFTQEDNTTNPLAYLVEVEGARPDLEIYDRQGHFFRPLYREPLFLLPPGAMPAHRREAERPVVAAALQAERPVVFSSPFLEYRPGEWSLVPYGTVGRVLPAGVTASSPLPALSPRHGPASRLDWMSRQIVAEAAIRSAHAALEEGRRGKAEILLGGAVWADIPEQHLRVAQLHIRMDEPQHAVAAARKALNDDPYLAPAWSVLGYALMKQDRPDEAERALRRALELDPSLPQPHASLGSLAAGRGDYRAAAPFFARSLDLDPGQPEVARMRRMAGVCASLPPDIPRAEGLERILLTAAEAGFPACVRQWLDGRSRDGRDGEMIEAYRRAEAATREQNAGDLR